VLWKCTSIVIDRSKASTHQPKPNARARRTAMTPCRECVEWISRRSSRRLRRIRARIPRAQPAPASGEKATSSRTELQTIAMLSAVMIRKVTSTRGTRKPGAR
jgi:hypothetical protein